MRTLLLLVLALLPLHGEQVLFTQEKADTLFHTLVDAEGAKDYAAFIAEGSADWKATISQRIFDDSSNVLGPRLKGGFTLEPAGARREKDRAVYSYRIHFKDSGKDMVGTLRLKNGQISSVVFE